MYSCTYVPGYVVHTIYFSLPGHIEAEREGEGGGGREVGGGGGGCPPEDLLLPLPTLTPPSPPLLPSSLRRCQLLSKNFGHHPPVKIGQKWEIFKKFQAAVNKILENFDLYKFNFKTDRIVQL